MTQTVMMVIGPDKKAAESGEWIDIINPANEKLHARAPKADAQDVDQAVRVARQAFAKGPWTRLTPSERGKLMFRLCDILEKHADELALLDTQDMGKPYRHAREHDLPGAIDYLQFHAGLCDKLRGSQVPSGPDKHIYILREPMGVVAAILPWNYPFLNAIMKLAPALSCGNTMVIKPAEQSPRSTLRLAELCLEAGLPPGVVNIITGMGETAGAALTAHRDIDMIAFTGSTAVGKLIMHAAAERICKVTLELGGKSANIVFPDADFEAALTSATRGICYNSGQDCTASSRLLVHRSIHDQFLESLIAKFNLLKIGDPMERDSNLGPVVSRDQYERVIRYIAIGQKDRAPIVCGTRPKPLERGFYVNPTIFDHVDPQSQIAQEEIFGPVLSVIEFDGEEDALRIANETSYGLACCIWTNDLSRAHRMAAQVDSGVVWVNSTDAWANPIPTEGHRQSGIGVGTGIEALESYTKMKSVIVNLDRAPTSMGERLMS